MTVSYSRPTFVFRELVFSYRSTCTQIAFAVYGQGMGCFLLVL